MKKEYHQLSNNHHSYQSSSLFHHKNNNSQNFPFQTQSKLIESQLHISEVIPFTNNISVQENTNSELDSKESVENFQMSRSSRFCARFQMQNNKREIEKKDTDKKELFKSLIEEPMIDREENKLSLKKKQLGSIIIQGLKEETEKSNGKKEISEANEHFLDEIIKESQKEQEEKEKQIFHDFDQISHILPEGGAYSDEESSEISLEFSHKENFSINKFPKSEGKTISKEDNEVRNLNKKKHSLEIETEKDLEKKNRKEEEREKKTHYAFLTFGTFLYFTFDKETREKLFKIEEENTAKEAVFYPTSRCYMINLMKEVLREYEEIDDDCCDFKLKHKINKINYEKRMVFVNIISNEEWEKEMENLGKTISRIFDQDKKIEELRQICEKYENGNRFPLKKRQTLFSFVNLVVRFVHTLEQHFSAQLKQNQNDLKNEEHTKTNSEKAVESEEENSCEDSQSNQSEDEDNSEDSSEDNKEKEENSDSDSDSDSLVSSHSSDNNDNDEDEKIGKRENGGSKDKKKENKKNEDWESDSGSANSSEEYGENNFYSSALLQKNENSKNSVSELDLENIINQLSMEVENSVREANPNSTNVNASIYTEVSSSVNISNIFEDNPESSCYGPRDFPAFLIGKHLEENVSEDNIKEIFGIIEEYRHKQYVHVGPRNRLFLFVERVMYQLQKVPENNMNLNFMKEERMKKFIENGRKLIGYFVPTLMLEAKEIIKRYSKGRKFHFVEKEKMMNHAKKIIQIRLFQYREISIMEDS